MNHLCPSASLTLNSCDRIAHNQAVPLRVNRCRLLKNREDAFNQSDALVGLNSCKPETSPGRRRPGADVPEFNYILGRAAKLITTRYKNTDGLSNCSVIGIVAL